MQERIKQRTLVTNIKNFNKVNKKMKEKQEVK